MERLNHWLMVLANLGVIAGIVFLAYEIRVNTQALTATTSTSYLQNWMNTSQPPDTELAEILATVGTQGWEAVPPARRSRVISFRIVQLKASEFAHYQWSQGLLDHQLWESNDAGMYGYFWGFPDVMEIYTFADIRATFYEGFRNHVDEMIADICSRKKCRSQSPFPPADDFADMGIGKSAWLARYR
jgi:hypothetical protein